MKIKSFGCSFIFGSDLAHSGLTWPALVANKLNYDHECFARPGSGNLQIMEQVLNQSTKSDPAVFVIGWTWIDRFDYYMAEWNPSDSKNPWKTILPVDQYTLAATYYRELHSEYRDKLVNLTYIKTTIDTLLQKKIRFIMTYMDRLLFDQRWHTSPAVIDMQTYIKPHMTLFDNETFLEYSQNRGYKISANLHPLEKAHEVAADHMVKVFEFNNN
jgi:hypothetical protein